MKSTNSDPTDQEDYEDDHFDNSNNIGKPKQKIKESIVNTLETHKKYKADVDILMSVDDDNNQSENIIIEKSPKGRFVRFDHSLGNGSFKRVYRGYDNDIGKEIAWNVINVGYMKDEEIKKTLEEINLIKKLDHPSIINYISGWVNEQKREVIFITDLHSGSLKQYLTRIKYPRLKVIKGWCKEILKGLKYLHEQAQPIIHRDIKCDNIFIDQNDGKITIGDLGYSCVLKNDFAYSFSGTPEFMSPEVFDLKYGTEADIYAFGMCVLEMITLEKPYKECTHILEIYEKAKNGILPMSLQRICDANIKEFILNCLKNFDERPSADQLLNSDFLSDVDSDANNFPVRLLDYELKQEIIHNDCHLKVNENTMSPKTPNHKKNNSLLNKSSKKTNLTAIEFNGLDHKKNEQVFNCYVDKSRQSIGNRSKKSANFSSSSSSSSLKDNFIKNNVKLYSSPCKNLLMSKETNLEIIMKDGRDGDKLTLILKLKKKNSEIYKKYKFFYHMKTDNCDKVTNEIHNKLNLTSYEIAEFHSQLSGIVKKIGVTSRKTSKIESSSKKAIELTSHFRQEYENIIKLTEKLLKVELSLAENLDDDIIKKRDNLAKILKILK